MDLAWLRREIFFLPTDPSMRCNVAQKSEKLKLSSFRSKIFGLLEFFIGTLFFFLALKTTFVKIKRSKVTLKCEYQMSRPIRGFTIDSDQISAVSVDVEK